ncbi:hypothetical protein [Pseudomonas tolaasii]|uniref:hypothetical protein n=1 Tax=Pseudomonas tolaasii TaxID=29442 RepID=UPI0015A03FE9|nr:hypothetical protein [Pseudomonas tolaasii]NWC38388.1 hypothetical protein [Pseudomonas tolaasii]
MRALLNAWLRRWAEASLRTELHQAQEKLIRQQNISERLISESKRQARLHKKKIECLTINHRQNASHNEKLIRALRDRMPPDLFLAVADHVHAKEKRCQS